MWGRLQGKTMNVLRNIAKFVFCVSTIAFIGLLVIVGGGLVIILIGGVLYSVFGGIGTVIVILFFFLFFWGAEEYDRANERKKYDEEN